MCPSFNDTKGRLAGFRRWRASCFRKVLAVKVSVKTFPHDAPRFPVVINGNVCISDVVTRMEEICFIRQIKQNICLLAFA